MDLQYGTSAYERNRGNFPVLPVINMFVESVPTETQPTLISRPGLSLTTTPNLGDLSSPVKNKGLFYIDGILNSDVFALTANNKLYKQNTLVGTIDGSGPPSFGGYANYLFLTSGSSLWKYDGTTLSTIATPGSFNVKSLCVGASHLIVVDSGTGKFFWSEALSTTLDALNFATAENSPDKLVDCLYIGDTLVLFGTETVELWPSTGDANAPFQPLIGRALNLGCRDTGCATAFNKAFAWITNHNSICFGDTDNVISHPGLEEKLSLSTEASLWTFWLEGTEFLAVRMDTDTYVFSAKSKQWSEFQSDGAANWTVNSYAKDVFGGAYSGSYFQWLTEDFTVGVYGGDASSTTFERRFRAGIPLTNGNVTVNNLTLRANEGFTPEWLASLPTDFKNPQVEMRTSMDGGQNWTAWQARSLGVHGKYRIPPIWRALGMFGYPGFLAEFRVTGRVPFRVSGATVNEAYGTR